MSSELVASVQSLVAVLQQQIHTSSHREPADTRDASGAPQTRATGHPPNSGVRTIQHNNGHMCRHRNDKKYGPSSTSLSCSTCYLMLCVHFQYDEHSVSSVVEELRLQLAQKERELQAAKDEAEELNSLRQQNYLLQSKVHNHAHRFHCSAATLTFMQSSR